MIFELPNTHISRQLKDMILHQSDLQSAKESIDAMHSYNQKIINTALIQSALISYYKCFGDSKFKHYRLEKSKVLSGLPQDAHDSFEFYRNLRRKFVVHDESRYADVYVGVVVESTNQTPFVDVVSLAFIADIATPEYSQVLSSLILATLDWVTKKIDELNRILINEYKSHSMKEFQTLNEIIYKPPKDDDWLNKRD